MCLLGCRENSGFHSYFPLGACRQLLAVQALLPLAWRVSGEDVDLPRGGKAMLPIKTILHPTDFSERSGFGFQLACSLARDYGAQLIVMHAAEQPMAFVGEGGVVSPPVVDLDALRQQLAQVLPEDPTLPVEHRLVQGDAAAQILRMAYETQCDVIVLGTHGRTGLSRLAMGSAAEQVLRRAPCPVVTVKAPVPATSAPGEATVESAGGVAFGPKR
jgi:nucleotide-binding universal stress UspA family protein